MYRKIWEELIISQFSLSLLMYEQISFHFFRSFNNLLSTILLFYFIPDIFHQIYLRVSFDCIINLKKQFSIVHCQYLEISTFDFYMSGLHPSILVNLLLVVPFGQISSDSIQIVISIENRSVYFFFYNRNAFSC